MSRGLGPPTQDRYMKSIIHHEKEVFLLKENVIIKGTIGLLGSGTGVVSASSWTGWRAVKLCNFQWKLHRVLIPLHCMCQQFCYVLIHYFYRKLIWYYFNICLHFLLLALRTLIWNKLHIIHLFYSCFYQRTGAHPIQRVIIMLFLLLLFSFRWKSPAIF